MNWYNFFEMLDKALNYFIAIGLYGAIAVPCITFAYAYKIAKKEKDKIHMAMAVFLFIATLVVWPQIVTCMVLVLFGIW